MVIISQKYELEHIYWDLKTSDIHQRFSDHFTATEIHSNKSYGQEAYH